MNPIAGTRSCAVSRARVVFRLVVMAAGGMFLFDRLDGADFRVNVAPMAGEA